jgi:hypothetical protein
VRASRDADSNCVSNSPPQSITVTKGVELIPAPVFAGLDRVLDSKQCDRLTLTWNEAVSVSPNSNIVYDIYRVATVADNGGRSEPTFTPAAGNRIAADVRGTSFIDSGLMRNNTYYYIVQARDATTGKTDTNNMGNRTVKFNAPTSPLFTATPPFARETFEEPTADARFTPPLAESGTDPNDGLAAFQRVEGVNLGNNTTSDVMYAPDFDPGSGGAQSDFFTRIGPLNLTPDSVMEFDHFFNTEADFDGGVLEIAVNPTGAFNAVPDNTTTFDLGNYIVEGFYTDLLEGSTAGEPATALSGRFAYAGSKSLHHVRVVLQDFAPWRT